MLIIPLGLVTFQAIWISVVGLEKQGLGLSHIMPRHKYLNMKAPVQ